MRRHERYSVKSLVSAGTGAVPLLLALVLISSSSSSFSACFTNKKIILSCHAFQTNLPTRHRNFGHASSAGITKQQKQTTELGISLDDFFGKSNPFGRNQDGSDDGKDKQEEDENYNVVEGNMLNIDSAVSSSFVDDVIIDTDIGIGIPRMNIEPFDEDDYAAGTTLISTIPVQSLKPGGLRLYLMFYLMGMQNTPSKNSWRADQPSKEEYVVEMLYHDATGMVTVELLKDQIRILRCGSRPSTSYLMHESMIVQGILDELYLCAFDESIDVNDRLLIPHPKEAIDTARDALAFA